MSSQQESPLHSSFAQHLYAFREYAYTDILGPKIMPMRYVINVFKGLTFLWVLFLMAYFNNYSTAMQLYLFLHGTYGIFWLFKDLYFPDASFKRMASFGSLVLLTLVLTLYWLMPVSIATGYGIQQPTQRRINFCLLTYLSGAFLMMGADIQKTSTLSKRKGLISTGFFSRTRNPNYLGQVMIYGSFAACTGFLGSYAIVLSIWGSIFVINMYLKDEYSYRFKQGWEEYKQKSYIMLPKIFKSDIINLAVYLGIVLILYNYYNECCDGHEHGHAHHDHHV